MKRLLTALVVLALVRSSFADIPALDPIKFKLLDQNEQLSSQLFSDSISKWMVSGAPQADPQILINRSLLDGSITDTIAGGTAAKLIAADLAHGDDLLRTNLAKMLYFYNFPESQAQAMITKWAGTGPDESLVSILNNVSEREETLGILREYMMAADANWVRAVSATSSILDGKSQMPVEVLRQSLINTGGVEARGASQLVKESQDGSAKSRFAVLSTMPRILEANGSLARFIKAQPIPESSFYSSVWTRVSAKVAGDPLLLQEYAKRSASAAEVYQTVRTILVRAFETGDEQLGGALARGAAIPGSRYEWLVDQALFTKGGVKGLESGYAQARGQIRIDMMREIGKNCAQSAQWNDFLLWHLTRVGEAATITTRLALQGVLSSDEQLAQRLAKPISLFGANFDSKLLGTDAYTFYQGGAAEFRARVASGDIERRALLQFSTAVGHLLATDDDAWADALRSVEPQSGNAAGARELVAVLAPAIEKDVSTASAWAKTIANNDNNLNAKFSAWMIQGQKARDAETFKRWLDSVNSAYRSGNILGNVDVANFKTWFTEFIGTPGGWDAMRLRLTLESSGVPGRMRQLMVDQCLADPKLFWKLYTTICKTSGYSVATIKPKMIVYTNQTGIARYLLDEIIAQNQLASDAVDPLWDQMLAKDAGTFKAMDGVMREGLVLSNAFSLGILAMDDALARPEIWNVAAPLVASHMRVADSKDPMLRENLHQQFLTEAGKSVPLLKELLDNPQVRERWRLSLLNAVRYSGKGYVVGSLIRKDYALSADWGKGLASIITEDPSIVRYMVESLGARRVGDPKWMASVRGMRISLAKMILEDRVFFEQLIADHNQAFRTNLKTSVSGIFGGFVAKEWVPE